MEGNGGSTQMMEACDSQTVLPEMVLARKVTMRKLFGGS
ncbi:hypothetical protein C5167_007745 [Papaver somniferum]|nr:hypothetical protein C5167_007738 [Papaver somniferum]RZC85130.1 hypothetical protein C5167_007745 [Papaver somniferum]